METFLVWATVAAAAVYALRRLVFRRRRAAAAERDSCNGNCTSCAFAGGSTACGSARGEDGAARPNRLTVIPAVALALAAGLPSGARAADTIETFDAGAWDVELYLGSDGLGAPSAERSVYGDFVLAYGLFDGFSAYVASALSADGAFGGGEPDARIGVFGTPVDTDRFDLDLLLEVGGAGDGLSSLWLAPGLEANLDLESPVGAWGPYLRASVSLNGEEHVHRDGSTSYRTGHSFDLNPGCRWSPAEGHELLVEYALARVAGEGSAPAVWEQGGAAVGYNVVVSDTFELVTQASLAPDDQDRWVPGVMLGFVATLPGAP